MVSRVLRVVVMRGGIKGGAQLFFFPLKQMSAQHVQLVSNYCRFLLSKETHACSVVPHLVLHVGLHCDARKGQIHVHGVGTNTKKF